MRYAVVIAALSLGSCGAPDPLQALYEDAPLTAVFDDLGPPDEAETLPDGRTQYVWRAAARETGLDPCVTRIITDGGGTVLDAEKTGGGGPC